jgi:lysozyme family protein
MKDTFAIAFDLVVGSEGGYQNDPKDRGNWTTGIIGKGQNKGTKFGVSAMSYPKLDIKNLSVNDARFIYYNDYWLKAGCDLWPTGVDYFVFDAAVNHGVSRAVKLLQAAVKATPDGVLGPRTKAAVRASQSRSMILSMGIDRDEFFDDLNKERFEDGWRKRAFEVSFNAYDLALGKLR